MLVSFDKSFSKSLDKIKNKSVLSKIEKIIIDCENATSIKQITNIKKMKGFKSFYRIKAGDYRIGIEILGNSIDFIIIAHRKDIYNQFP